MRENPEQRQVGGGTPSGGALQPSGALGELPSHPQGRGGSRDPRLGAAEGMPGGKYLPAPLPQPKHAADGQDLQGSIAKLPGCRRARIPRERWQAVDP